MWSVYSIRAIRWRIVNQLFCIYMFLEHEFIATLLPITWHNNQPLYKYSDADTRVIILPHLIKITTGHSEVIPVHLRSSYIHIYGQSRYYARHRCVAVHHIVLYMPILCLQHCCCCISFDRWLYKLLDYLGCMLCRPHIFSRDCKLL